MSRDGEEAILYLCAREKFSNRAEYPLPDLILLDLKMPRMDGFELLRWIKNQPELCNIRVIVLTSSTQYDDINRAYQLGANSFLIKPQEFRNFAEDCKLLQKYWLHTDKAPAVSRPRDTTRTKHPESTKAGQR
jgi:CheY-like chemotaxis protein